MSRACDGCLGSAECWICTGAGCPRCASTGRCHLCAPERVLHLVPPQEARPVPVDQPQTAGAS